MLNGIRARVGAGRPASAPRRGFFLEKEPMPAVLPGQGLVPRPPLVTEQQVTPPPPQSDTITIRLDNSDARFTPSADTSGLRAQYRELEGLYLAACQKLREVTADRDALDAANGRLVAEVRQLRAAGIEPAPRSAT